jgi:cytochrome c-type biogenesis protein
MDNSSITVGLAFIAGIASFLSPCVFALVPAYVSYLSGRSMGGTSEDSKSKSWETLSHGFAFVLGFSIVFVLLGVFASALGGVLYDLNQILVKVGGILVVIFGLHMIGIIRIPFLEYDLRRQSHPTRSRGYLSSILMGVFFSAGWSPCVGPVLGAILTLALNGGSISQGALLLSAYSAGLAIPFLIAATQIGWVTSIIRRYGKLMLYVEKIMGVVLLVIGVLLFSGRFATLATFGAFFDTFDELSIGRLLLIGLISSMIIGLIPGFAARYKGKNFVDWWFIGSGISLLLLVLLSVLGVLPSNI